MMSLLRINTTWRKKIVLCVLALCSKLPVSVTERSTVLSVKVVWLLEITVVFIKSIAFLEEIRCTVNFKPWFSCLNKVLC